MFNRHWFHYINLLKLFYFLLFFTVNNTKEKKKEKISKSNSKNYSKSKSNYQSFIKINFLWMRRKKKNLFLNEPYGSEDFSSLHDVLLDTSSVYMCAYVYYDNRAQPFHLTEWTMNWISCSTLPHMFMCMSVFVHCFQSGYITIYFNRWKQKKKKI